LHAILNFNSAVKQIVLDLIDSVLKGIIKPETRAAKGSAKAIVKQIVLDLIDSVLKGILKAETRAAKGSAKAASKALLALKRSRPPASRIKSSSNGDGPKVKKIKPK
jgi:hypothetical protein